MDEFVAKLNEYLALAEQAVAEVGPEVWELTLLIMRLGGVLKLAASAIGLAFAVWLWLVPVRRKVYPWVKAGIGYHEREMVYIPFALVSAVCVAAFLVCWINLGNWLAVFSPKAAIVYRVGQQAGIF